ncbi:hypothetical protein CYCD_11350 [Tenuifilaceae bacterium CYCD]|nr:hypothetical protein CYCD_11350 [Tenuifilaceae bacterium CYCD]
MKRFSTILFLLITTYSTFCQTDNQKGITVTGFIENGKVMLRWAPSNPTSWIRGNNVGYSVYRIPIIKDGQIIEKPDTIFLGSFKPDPLSNWENNADSSSFAVAAEVIYGKNLEVTTTANNNFFELINKSKEQQNRFSVGLLCADQSFTVACMMGLGLIDSTANTQYTYAYRVVANYSDSSKIHEDGYAYIDFKTGNFTPRPFGVSYNVNGSQISILIPYEPFKGIYNNFEIERSTDQANFRTITGKNYYSMSTAEDDPKYNIYTDSIKQEVTTFYYRLRGKTPFDTYGPYSDTIEVKIMPTIESSPWITDIKEIENKISISWDIQDSTKNLKGFMLYSSPNQGGPFKPELKENLDKTNRYAYIQKPQDYSYYRVAAIDQFNRLYFSSSRLFQAIDSLPPLSPTGLKGQFDSTGIVHLQWNYGKEPDLLGYQLLFSANSESEYTLVCKDFIYDSTYSAKFPLNMLSSNLYFKAVALDTRYNTSKASEPVILVKPDTIPPSPPLLMIYTDSIGKTTVKIAPSNSNDVVLHRLLYQEEQSLSPTELFIGAIKTDTSFVLQGTHERGILFCEAIDISGRKGESDKLPFYTSKTKAEPFVAKAEPDIDNGNLIIHWGKEKNNGSIMIYRKLENGKYNLIATVESKIGEYVDRNVFINNCYYYKLIYRPKDEKIISETLNICFR